VKKTRAALSPNLSQFRATQPKFYRISMYILDNVIYRRVAVRLKILWFLHSIGGELCYMGYITHIEARSWKTRGEHSIEIALVSLGQYSASLIQYRASEAVRRAWTMPPDPEVASTAPPPTMQL
jgi:hypothetical protein